MYDNRHLQYSRNGAPGCRCVQLVVADPVDLSAVRSGSAGRRRLAEGIPAILMAREDVNWASLPSKSPLHRWQFVAV
jgi:hypothetical protein